MGAMSCLSDTYDSWFRVEGSLFHSVHQYLYYVRAIQECNTGLALKIKNTKTESELKPLLYEFGQPSASWNKLKEDYRFRGILSKFKCNPAFKRCLLDADMEQLQQSTNTFIDAGILGNVRVILMSE